MWDLADQPDLRTAGATPTEIRAFLAHESRVLRALDPSTPMTVSWSDPAAAADPAMIDLVDVVSLHWTGAPGDLPAAVETVRAAAGSRPVMVTATTSGTEGGWSPRPHTDRRQAAEVAQVLLTAEQNGVSRTAVDRLQDAGVDRDGFLRADGSAKPAAALVRPGAPLTGVAGSGLADYAASNFWRTVVAVAFFGTLFVFRHRLITAGRGPRAGRIRRRLRSRFRRPRPPG